MIQQWQPVETNKFNVTWLHYSHQELPLRIYNYSVTYASSRHPLLVQDVMTFKGLVFHFITF